MLIKVFFYVDFITNFYYLRNLFSGKSLYKSYNSDGGIMVCFQLPTYIGD